MLMLGVRSAGPSVAGCGKSTLVKALCGLHPLESGSVRVCGALVAAAAPSPGASSGSGNSSGSDSGSSAAAGAAATNSSSSAAVASALSASTTLPAAALQAALPAGGGPGLMVVPQRPLAAPGHELWQQVAYPDTQRPPDAEVRRVLAAVGLGYLEGRAAAAAASAAEGSEGGASGWGAALSPGELQRLSVARVLYRQVAAGPGRGAC